jgi:DNA-binding PadR family transcriptional regulator
LPRRRDGAPVENEERIAVAALRIANLRRRGEDEPRFWVRDIQDELSSLDPAAALNDSTVNRALNRFVSIGWMWASWETADPANRLSSRPRMYFHVTAEGRTAIRELIATKRQELPLWLLYPADLVGEVIEDPRLPALLDKAKASTFRKPRTTGPTPASKRFDPGGEGRRITPRQTSRRAAEDM